MSTQGRMTNADTLTGGVNTSGEMVARTAAAQSLSGKLNRAGEVNASISKPETVYGVDGFSPTIDVTEIEGGYRLTITDRAGEKIIDVLHGADGKDGADGEDGKDGTNGTNGKDGADGKDGTNGVSPTVSTEAITGGTRITITGASGTKTVDVMNGTNGKDGADGKDGTNGTNGKDGADGKTPVKGTDYFTEADKEEFLGEMGAVRYEAQTLTEAQKAQARENIGAVAKSGISLGVHSDGLVYVFVDGSPVGDGIELATAGDVIGYVDENNNVILTGALADGTYNIKYEMEDGSTVDIGDLVLDTNVYYSVTNTLTNCVSNNSETEVIEGESYSAIITANEGYELSSVVVTMGGVDITESAVVNGNIVNIESVTGDISIVATAELAAVAEPVTETITLLEETSLKGADFNEDRTGTAGYCATPAIDLSNIPKPCTINLTGARWAYADNTSTGYVRFSIFDTSGSKLVSGYTYPSVMPSGVTMTVNNGDESDVTVTVTSDNIGTLRFAGYWAWSNIEENLNGTVMVAKATLTYTPNS